MASQLQVYNRALNLLGLDPISSVDQDDKKTRTLNIAYDMVLEELLIEENWNFATKRIKLAQLTDADQTKYRYAYQYPADCLKIIHVEADDDIMTPTQYRRKYQVIGDIIYSDQEGLYLEYLVVPSGQYFVGFNKCLAYKLAIECCYPLINSNSREERLSNKYENIILPKAISLDAMQEDPLVTVNYLEQIGDNINQTNVGGR